MKYTVITQYYDADEVIQTVKEEFGSMLDARSEMRHALEDEATILVKIWEGDYKVSPMETVQGKSFREMALTPAERQARRRARQQAAGFKEVRGIWATPEQEIKIKQFARSLV